MMIDSGKQTTYRRSKSVFRLIISLLGAILFLLPLYWAFVVSLRPIGLPPPLSILWWPAEAAWENYAKIFDLVPFSRYFFNSVRVVAVAVPLTWLIASVTGFALSRLPFSWRRIIIPLTAILLIIPPVAVWIVRFRLYEAAGVLDTLWALIAPAFMGGSPLFVLLFYWTFRRIPDDYFEAAWIDGASWWQNWLFIARPLARPTSAAVVVLAFVKFWSDFTDPVLYIFNTRLYTLPVGLQLIKQLDQTDIPLLMVAAIYMILPILVVFIALQRAFLNERMAGQTVITPPNASVGNPLEK